ncbi:MAG: DNA mismatch repair endonuclease MutL [Oscillospiraceae bacterium]|nr:DNA mismatch repair endonuclease MutL [Oscillospiraceae bacterium]
MADIIRRLDPQVANLIAAGEVVERPASIVKELCENAIDAGATEITVEIKHGGLTYIRVTDNGKGMSRNDARTAFMRHATSKISSEADLEAIGTRGFRGEALAAIGAVSRVQMLTRQKGEIEGTAISVDAGEVTQYDPAGCPEGTTIIVRGLFYNTPARMKFLKKDASEAAACMSEIQRQALSRPDISLTAIKDDAQIFKTSGKGDLKDTVLTVLGRDFSNNMLAAKAAAQDIIVTGYVTKPIASRGNRTWQYFFVNGRPIRSRTLSAALEEGYSNLIAKGRFPGCVLDIKVRPSTVDVNVHPSKAEVKFASDREIFSAVYHAALSAVSGREAPPTFSRDSAPTYSSPQDTAAAFDFGTPFDMVAQNYHQPQTVEQYREYLDNIERLRLARNAAEELEKGVYPTQTAITTDQAVPVTYEPLERQSDLELEEERILPQDTEIRIVGEVMGTYILVEYPEGLLIVDKHAAHERILFEKFRLRDEKLMSQRLISPITIYFSDASALIENLGLLNDVGFDAEDFGGGTIIIRAVPQGVDVGDVEPLLEEICHKFKSGKSTAYDLLRDEILHSMSCKAAIKRGDITDRAEMESLIRQVLTRGDVRYCPHGRPIVMRLERTTLDRHFGR